MIDFFNDIDNEGGDGMATHVMPIFAEVHNSPADSDNQLT